MLPANRPSIFCSLVLAAVCCPLTAQEPTPAEKPEPQAEAKAQEPAAKPLPPEEDPAVRLATLQRRLEKIDGEIAFIQEIAAKGGLLTRVAPFLHDRSVNAQVIKLAADAVPESPTERVENPQIGMPGATEVTPKPPMGRLFGDAEKERLGAEVIATVDGAPLTQAEFDQLFDYYKSYPRSESDEDLRRLTMHGLILRKACEAHFADSAPAALKLIEDVQARLEAGEDFAEVAKSSSQCPSASQGGFLGAFERGSMAPAFEMAAFGLKVGETSGIVESTFGYHIIRVSKYEDGEDRAKDRVTASHILAMYGKDVNEVRSRVEKAQRGEVELAFVDDSWRQLAPRQH